MSIKIKPLRKFTTGTPSTSDMVEGELAVNTADKKVFMRDDSNNIVEVGAASSLSLPITGGTLTGDLSVSSTADGGPALNLISNDPGDVADFATEGAIFFKAENSASQSVEYANIKLLTDDVSDTTEDGRIRFNVAKAGTVTDVFDITSTRIQIRQSIPLSWQNAGGNGVHTTLEVATPSSSRTITLPDATGTVALTSQLPSTALDDIGAGDAAVNLTTTTGNITIDAQGSDTDIIFKGTDNTTDITALTLDMSEGGKAIFGGQASFGAELIVDMPHGGTYTKPAQFLVNDVNNGDHAQFTFGKRLANDELVEFGYYHVGTNSNENICSIGFYGSSVRYAQNPLGQVTIGGSITGGGYFNEILNVNGNIWTNGSIVFEGATADGFETTLAVTDPTDSDKTITLPNATGTVLINSGNQTLSGDLTVDRLDLSNGLSIQGLSVSNVNGDLVIDASRSIYIDADMDQATDAIFLRDGGTVFGTFKSVDDQGSANNIIYKGTGNVLATGNPEIRGAYGSTSAPRIFTVTVATQTAAHPYNGDGSTNKYSIDGIQGAALELHGADSTTANSEYIYRFDQSDGTNANHPLRFYLDAAKTRQYTTGVSTNGVPGQSGAYTQIAVTRDTPKILYYQCNQHGYMGNYVTIVNSVRGDPLFPSGTTNSGLPTPGAINLANPVENDDHVFHPYLNNDLGHFVERGGTVSYSGFSSNPSSNATKSMFNANADTNTIANTNFTGSTATITLTDLPKSLAYSAYVGIVFGHDNFAPDSMVIETSTNNGSNWTTRLTDSSKKTVYTCTFDTGSTATNAIRFTFTDSSLSSQIRIQSIAAYNYNSAGMENYFLPLDGGTVYGDIHTTGSINLGHASDTTLSRSSAGVVTIEGGEILTENSSIAKLADVVTTGISDGQVLKYNASVGRFEPGADATGGGGGGSSAADDITEGDAAVNLTTTSGNITIDAQGNDTDIIFKGTDGGTDRTFLTLDGSNFGALNLGEFTGLIFPATNSGRLYIGGTGTGTQIFKSGTGASASTLITTGEGSLDLKTNFNKKGIAIEPNAEVQLFHADIKKFETTSTGVKTVGTVDVNGAYTLPTSDGSANQVLKTDGSGTLSFTTVSGVGSGVSEEQAIAFAVALG